MGGLYLWILTAHPNYWYFRADFGGLMGLSGALGFTKLQSGVCGGMAF